MRLELENFEKDGEFEYVFQPNELALDEGELRLIGSVEVRGRLHRSGDEAEVTGTLKATLETRCARCLKPVTIPIDAQFSERFVTAVSWRLEEQHELLREDLNLSVFDGEAIDLDQLVREEILLATPAHILCREDCKGLCPICGLDRNVSECTCETRQVDSRWEKLKDLRF